ncbi:LytR/AlgR family response regulator transcription factor [Tenacibaculum agarivorans]|uniref:LytR/AlgR family response regulator transcription factor n=1 Tax=Tenacibaculum agarivorans TaxID=1908389 RepID=UPI00094BC45D|nr:LytTR family DNA-binding domain-containing protein [Tenacibaculum agarivorans]
MLRSLLIEDEQHVREELQNLIAKNFTNKLSIVEEATSVKEGIKAILKHNPDLVFLDVDLGDGSSFEILDMLPEINFDIIFVTGYDSHAIKAIKLGALDYLLKPIDEDELVVAINKAIQQHNKENIKEKLVNVASNYYKNGLHNKIVVKTLEAQHILNFEDIIFCKSEGNYTTFHLTNEQVLVSKPMKKLQPLLDENIFLKCHQSFLVNTSYVTKYLNEGFLVTKNGDQIPVATRRKEDVLNLLFKS